MANYWQTPLAARQWQLCSAGVRGTRRFLTSRQCCICERATCLRYTLRRPQGKEGRGGRGLYKPHSSGGIANTAPAVGGTGTPYPHPHPHPHASTYPDTPRRAAPRQATPRHAMPRHTTPSHSPIPNSDCGRDATRRGRVRPGPLIVHTFICLAKIG